MMIVIFFGKDDNDDDDERVAKKTMNKVNDFFLNRSQYQQHSDWNIFIKIKSAIKDWGITDFDQP